MTLLQVLRDNYSIPYFDAAAVGQLLIRRCNACGQSSEPASLRCGNCHSDDVEWVKSDGQGRVVSWAVPHVRDESGAMVPSYAIAIVQLAEGPWLHAQIRTADLTAIDAGASVHIEFESVEGGEPLPVASPAA